VEFKQVMFYEGDKVKINCPDDRWRISKLNGQIGTVVTSSFSGAVYYIDVNGLIKEIASNHLLSAEFNLIDWLERDENTQTDRNGNN